MFEYNSLDTMEVIKVVFLLQHNLTHTKAHVLFHCSLLPFRY